MSTTTAKHGSFESLEPNHPASLETSLQLEDFDSASDPSLIEALFKLHALFTPHLVLHEAQLLDHVGMRIFFTNLERTNPSEFRALVDYLTDPGKDPLELAPVIVASEYDPADPAQIIPLDALLRRKLAVDDPIRVPWQFGSIDPPRRRAAVNRQILESKGLHRYEFALRNVAITPDEYPGYLRLISTIWDRSAEVTRYNLPKPDYRKTLMTLLGESKLDDRELGAGERLREALSIGKLTFNDGREITQFDQTSVLLWVRERTSGSDLRGDLWGVIKRAHPEAFLRAFPAKAGWLSGTDPAQLGYWVGVERAAGQQEKLSPHTALGRVAQEHVEVETGGQLVLDQISYRELHKLRANDEFQQSLRTLNQVWTNDNNYSHFMETLKHHIDLVYSILGANKRSSRHRADGPHVGLEVWDYFEQVISAKDFAEAIFLLLPALSLATVLPRDSPKSLEFYAATVAGALVIRNLYRWTQPKREWRHLAERVGGAARGKQVQDGL